MPADLKNAFAESCCDGGACGLDDNSAAPCGCDKGAGWVCERHREDVMRNTVPAMGWAERRLVQVGLPTTDAERKRIPFFTGLLMYFPLALAAVAEVSRVGNEQHNPGEPLHWAREKSTDQLNTAMRHLIDHGMGTTRDTDGTWHLAKAIWRLCAELQLEIERTKQKPG